MKTEIIAIASGKGGTGKTVVTACLGYALTRAGHRTLMVDSDLATNGLSLFLMGPEGIRRVKSVPLESTLRGILTKFQLTGIIDLKAHPINRKVAPSLDAKEAGDSGVIYQAIISDGESIYGDPAGLNEPVVPALTRDMFRHAVRAFFDTLRSDESPEAFDYVIVDTRGGFAFESTDICALADSFIVVTEPDYTSFYQDRNLVDRINTAGQELQQKSLIRAAIVNKATEGKEENFRLALQREFNLRFEDTYALPLDPETISGYRTQQIPYMVAPGSDFSNATLAAFADIFQFVTGAWAEDRVDRWNELVQMVSTAAAARKSKREKADAERKLQDEAFSQLTEERDRLAERTASLERELQVTTVHLKRIEEYGESNPFVRLRKWGPWRKMLLAYFFLAVLGFTTFLVYYGYRELKGASTDSRLERLYATGGPPALRQALLLDLYKAGVRNFDSIDLSGTNLAGIDLSGVSMAGARMNGVSLSEARLDRANLRNARLESADLNGTSMVGANLAGAILRGAHLRAAQLKNAVFSLADLSKADLRDADLSGANLRGANLNGAEVRLEQLKTSELDVDTVLPSGVRYGAPIEGSQRTPSRR
jgi:MinD-like ATPase involved in chromosome partitioning or flagellar assembly